VQLLARCKHICPRTPDESAPPDVAELRNVSCEYASHLRFEIPASSGNGSRGRPIARPPVAGRSVKRRRHVRRDLLDASGMVSTGLGALGRFPADYSV